MKVTHRSKILKTICICQTLFIDFDHNALNFRKFKEWYMENVTVLTILWETTVNIACLTTMIFHGDLQQEKQRMNVKVKWLLLIF